MTREIASKTLQTTATSLDILDHIDQMDGARVSELADRLDSPKSTVHSHLMTLVAKEFVIKRGDLYCLGPELLRLGNHVRTRREGYVLARGFTEKLFETLGFRATFAAEMGGKAVFIHSATGNQLGWAHERMGNRLYLHNTAVGKSILAELPEFRVDQILDEWGLPRETANTITDRETLDDELEEIPKKGYAVNRAENIENLYAIGVAAKEESGEVIGAFSITGPEHALLGSNREGELADTVTEIVEEYELELSVSRTPPQEPVS